MRLIIISNRLPITITKTDRGFTYKQTSGGLVTGLKCVKQSKPFVWLGNISGIEDEGEKSIITADCWDQFQSIPLFISKELNEKSYNGFCNKILWPLLHSFVDNVVWNQTSYDAYLEYNNKFCDKVCEIAEDGDVIWVHDYHLMLLPKMVRERCKKNIKIAYFLHTPFSSPSVFTTLPVAREILLGILGSDIVGFHIWDYANEFIESCKETLKLKHFEKESDEDIIMAKKVQSKIIGKVGVVKNGIEYMPNEMTLGNRKIKIHAVSIGIEPKMFRETLELDEVKERINELKTKFAGQKIVLCVDRTDYIKGIPHRFKAIEEYLKTNDNCVFLQIAVPSRMDVIEYKTLIDNVKHMTSAINSEIGNVDDTKVYLLNKSVNFNELCALYAAADVCLITSLRDGMNLVALEYIACQEDNHGVLLLSEFAGATTTLLGSVSCNPWDIIETAKAIEQSVKMDDMERKERYELNKFAIDKFTALNWAEENLKVLESVRGKEIE